MIHDCPSPGSWACQLPYPPGGPGDSWQARGGAWQSPIAGPRIGFQGWQAAIMSRIMGTARAPAV
eukprot:746116-Hanusia_phi.AAC.4